MKCCAGDLSSAAAELRKVTCSAAELRNFDIELLRVCFDKGIQLMKGQVHSLENVALSPPRTIKLDFSKTKLCFNSRAAVAAAMGGTLRGSWSYSKDRKDEGIRSSCCRPGERGR